MSGQSPRPAAEDAATRTLARHDIGPGREPPRAALVAGLPGDDINGTFVLSRLADLLHRAWTGEHPEYRLLRRVLVIPAAGAGAGAEPASQQLLEATRNAWLRVAVRSAEAALEALPQVQLYGAHDDERASAFLFGLPAIVERPAAADSAPALAQAWRPHGGESFVIEAGQPGALQLPHCERLFQALLNFLRHKEVIAGGTLTDFDEDVHLFGPEQTAPLVAAEAGLFVTHLDVGRWMQPGETLGHVYDPFDGRILRELTVPVGGLLASLRRQPRVGAGELVARIQSRQPLPAG